MIVRVISWKASRRRSSASLIQSRQRALGLRQPSPQGSFRRLRLFQRTQHQPPFGPGDGLAIQLRRQHLQPFVAGGDPFPLALPLFPIDIGEGLLPTVHR